MVSLMDEWSLHTSIINFITSKMKLSIRVFCKVVLTKYKEYSVSYKYNLIFFQIYGLYPTKYVVVHYVMKNVCYMWSQWTHICEDWIKIIVTLLSRYVISIQYCPLLCCLLNDVTLPQDVLNLWWVCSYGSLLWFWKEL